MTKFFDAILGRSKPVPAKLDNLFALPGAAVTLQIESGLVSSGQAGVCFKPVADASFAEVQGGISQLLAMLRERQQLKLEELDDKLGYHWVIITEPDIGELVTNVHAVNSGLEDAGYGPQLLCSVFGFVPAPEATPAQGPPHTYIVYLFKRGAFYPFIPSGPEKRDNVGELHLKGILEKDLKVEEDLQRWFPIWGAPVS